MARSRELKVPVILEGQGADEALGGYAQYSILYLISRLVAWPPRFIDGKTGPGAIALWRGMLRTYPAQLVVLRLVREALPSLIPTYRTARGSLGALRQEFCKSVRSRVEYDIPKDLQRVDSVTRRLHYDHSYRILPGLLHYGDAVSMAHGIESRHPFLDYRLVESTSRQGTGMRIQGQMKWLIRNYLRSQGWSEFGDRWDKLGYPTRTGGWMRQSHADQIIELLLSAESRASRYCVPSQVRRLIDMHASGRSGAENDLVDSSAPSCGSGRAFRCHARD